MPPALIGIRPANGADAGALTAIFLAARRASMAYLPTLHTDDQTRWWVEHVVLARSRVLVAVLDGAPVGFAALGQATLEHLYVAPGAQSRGVGAALVTAAQASGRRLVLHVFEQNMDARRFYLRHGFVVTGGSSGAGNEEGLPDIEMTWAGRGE